MEPEEWETAFAPGGALEAVVEAKEQGLVSHIGVTGHGVTVAAQHLRSLERYPFDSVLLPYNFAMSNNTAYLDDFEALVAVCAERDVAVQTIKSITRAPWGDREQTASTWYEPLTDQGAIDTAVAWVLGRDGTVPEHRRRRHHPALGAGGRGQGDRTARGRRDAGAGGFVRTSAALHLSPSLLSVASAMLLG